MFRFFYKLVRIRTRLDAVRWSIAVTLGAVIFSKLFFSFLAFGPFQLSPQISVLITAVLIAAPSSYWACMQIFFIYQLGTKLKSQVEVDGLTQASSRRYLFENLFEKLREDPAEYTLLMVDIDHFKSINDRFTHLVGDQVLKHVASKMKTTCRDTDTVCRFGGEEFVVVLPNCTLDTGLATAERMRSIVATSKFYTEGNNLPVTVSIGAASGILEFTSPEDVLRRADSALYKAKSGGRNKVVSAEDDRGKNVISIAIAK